MPPADGGLLYLVWEGLQDPGSPRLDLGPTDSESTENRPDRFLILFVMEQKVAI